MNILRQIGNTPLLKLRQVNEVPDVDIYVKCEYLNPGGSIKDRMALSMIEAAEKSGELKPGGTIVDQSTGNTGPALSFVGAVKGYDVQLFLPAQLGSAYNPEDRIRIARLFGCKVTPIDLEEQLADIDELSEVERAAAFVAIRMKQCYELQQRETNCAMSTIREPIGKTRAKRYWTSWTERLMPGLLLLALVARCWVWQKPLKKRTRI
jgi:cysteine synthase